MKAIQRNDPESTSEERINKVIQIVVRKVVGDPSSYMFALHLESESGDTIGMAKMLSMEHQKLPPTIRNIFWDNSISKRRTMKK